MTPDDLRLVAGSWAALRRCRPVMIDGLCRHITALASPSPSSVPERAAWLFDAVEALVGLLPAPSCLANRARALGETWPDPLTAPSFCVEGRAWLGAARDCLPSWTDATADAWRHAWLLLSDVLAVEALSPFCDTPD